VQGPLVPYVAHMSFQIFNPDTFEEPKGFSHGLSWTGEGRILFIAGQPAIGPDGAVIDAGFVEQFALCLDRILTIVAQAGGAAENIGRMTIYVSDMAAYKSSRRELGAAYRERMGRHFPVMALLGVSELVDDGAIVEIEATAVVP
jgi:enamine deaminase RidA (YjgF/YER057c/UK114 family)